jgi:hypothetical protein
MAEIKCQDEFFKFLLHEPKMDVLHVEFIEADSRYEPAICISRKASNGDKIFIKQEIGDQADILYRLLTDQSAKAEIK